MHFWKWPSSKYKNERYSAAERLFSLTERALYRDMTAYYLFKPIALVRRKYEISSSRVSSGNS